jgi:GAF domain-containing protein/HAMP domain-containing protein
LGKVIAMKKLSLGQKVLLANLTTILIFALTAAISVITLQRSRQTIRQSAEAINPSVETIDRFILMASRAKMYITNWVFLSTNETDKEALKELHNFEFPALKEKASRLKRTWKNPEQVAELDSIIIRFDEMLVIHRDIMDKFSEFGDYNDPNNIFYANEIIEDKVIPITYALIDRLDVLAKAKRAEKEKYEVQVAASLSTLNNLIIFLGVVSVFIGLIASFFVFRSVSYPIKYVNNVAQELSLGGIPKDYEKEFGSDEIGEMARSMKKLVNGLKATSAFAEGIGQGLYKQDYQPLSSHDILGNSLINMRNNLEKVAKDDEVRIWATEGIAKFSDIMRTNYNNINRFSGEVIVNLVKYVEANQGGIFITEEDSLQAEEPFMALHGCYAWDKQRYLEKLIYKGEGLAGQAWQENRTLYVSEIPQNYINISSGLGMANPTSILIVPLRLNEMVFGVIEMAFFRHLQPHEIAFIEKIAENFAATLSSVRTNEKTQRLLEESQTLTEQLRSQEEEMRQNVEELQATQEEMRRTQKEVEDKEAVINSLHILIETDHNFIIQRANQNIGTTLGYHITDVLGQPFAKFFDSQIEFLLMTRALEGGKTYSKVVHLFDVAKSPALMKISAAAIYAKNTQGLNYLFVIDQINMGELKKLLEKQSVML